jgi:predicted DCC family thiol-disulfide oxidoreductase YuxK
LADQKPIILFDGVCNFCNGAVNFIIKRDKNANIKFAALQSHTGQKLLEEYMLPKKNFNSFVLIHNGKAFHKTTAALHTITYLPPIWKWAKIFWIVPRFLRDAVYDVIAANRYKWFGKKEQCMIPAAGIKERFLN